MSCNPANTPSIGKPCDASRQGLAHSLTNGGFYEEIEHTADLALRCGGPDLDSFFRSAAMGMYHLMGIGKTPADGTLTKAVALDAMDMESLLVDWLGELAYLAETENLVFGTIQFQTLSDTCIEAVLTGSRVSRIDKVIKAVTFHQLEIQKTHEGYAATVVFDV
jgi:SHS2 domain-containing protein